MTKQEFVKHAYAAALKSSARSGMPARVTVAQAALESNWGQSALSREASNYFGIKAHGSQAKVAMSTCECEKGHAVEIKAEFAKYPSMQECFECRDALILKGTVYAGARRAMGDEREFIQELAKHWATDPKYPEKLEAMLAEVKEILEA